VLISRILRKQCMKSEGKTQKFFLMFEQVIHIVTTVQVKCTIMLNKV
jgi:hypothetical protein